MARTENLRILGYTKFRIMTVIVKGDVVSSMGNKMTVRRFTSKGQVITNWFDGEIITEGIFTNAELDVKPSKKSDCEFEIGDCVHLRSEKALDLIILDVIEHMDDILIECRYWFKRKTHIIKLYKEQLEKEETPRSRR